MTCTSSGTLSVNVCSKKVVESKDVLRSSCFSQNDVCKIQNTKSA